MKKTTFMLLWALISVITLKAQVVTEITKTIPIPDSLSVSEYYGSSVAIDGDYAVVGSSGYKNYTGKATILYYNGTNWEYVATLTASDSDEYIYFGVSAYISDNTIFIGASSAPGNSSTSGAVYVFEKPGSGWADMTETAKLTASDGANYDYFGNAISGSENTIVIGAYQKSDIASYCGAAYIFEKPESDWTTMTETAKLTASNGAKYSNFGCSLQISDTTIVIGAYGESNNGISSGAAYVFVKPSAGWTDTTETAILTPMDGANSDEFGYAVSIMDSIIVIGSDKDDDSYSGSGSAYIFTKPKTGWESTATYAAKINASDANKNAKFGSKVCINDDAIIIGAIGDNDMGAVYIYDIPTTGWSNIAEKAKLTASDKAEDDLFGSEIWMSSKTIIVGAYQDDDRGKSSGSIYIFDKPASGWTTTTETEKQLSYSGKTTANTYYGESVSIDGNYAVVGARHYNSYSGKAHVLYYDGTEWEVIATLTASDAEENDFFGRSVSISGNTIVAGAYGDDDKDSESGSAYVFVKPESGWTDMTETAKLTASDGTKRNDFGYTVDISDNTIVVGAFHIDSYTGAAYVFVKPESGWKNMTETAKLTATDGAIEDYFGGSLSIDDSVIVVGAYCDDDNGSSSGSVYIFKESSTGWENMTETKKIVAADGAAYDYFGISVGISGQTVVVGAKFDDDSASNSGSLYVFEAPASDWSNATQTAKLTASDFYDNAYLGYSVSIDDTLIVAGSIFYSGTKGAGYLFIKPKTGWTDTTQTTKFNASDGEYADDYGCSIDISDTMIVVGAYLDDNEGIDGGAAYFYALVYPDPIEILYQPTDITSTCRDVSVTYSVEGKNEETYQWQVKTDSDTSFISIVDTGFYSNATTSTLIVVADTSLNNSLYRCILANPGYSDTTNNVSLVLETTPPTISCIGDTEKSIASGSTTYTVEGTEFDLTETLDDCGIATIVNNFNNTSTLDGASIPAGTTTITWTVIDNTGNIATCSTNITINPTSDISRANVEKFSIYPNPVSSSLTVESNITIENIQIVTITGAVLYSEIVNNTEAHLDMQNLQNGIYFIKMGTSEGIHMRRIIKQ